MILLCADDFGLTAGVSKAIAELARSRRLSATSAMVTFEDWHNHATALAGLRADISVGVHLNLTLGRPLTTMAHTAPEGELPSVGQLVVRALTGRIARDEITTEFIRQLEHFQAAVGYPPDHIDGHQHAHALPVIRHALIAAIRTMGWRTRPLVRTPSDGVSNIFGRKSSRAKALAIGALSSGLRKALAAAGLPTNDTFAGFSTFDRKVDYRGELVDQLSHAGQRHLVMCHPGHVDNDLRRRDPVVERRAEEFDALMTAPALSPRIWHPVRVADGEPIDWSTAT